MMQASCQKLFFLGLLLFARGNYAIDFFNASIKDGQTIAIYIGAFDPICFEHDEAIRYVFARNIADCVIIVPDSNVNYCESLITNANECNKLLSYLYDAESNVITTTLHNQDLLYYLAAKFKNSKRVIVFSSENYLCHLQDGTAPQLGADSWLVIPTDEDKDNDLLKKYTTFAGKPLIVADEKCLRYQGYSSTKVKNLVRANPNIYSGLFDPAVDQFLIDPLTRDFICDFRLYQRISRAITESRNLINRIEEVIIEQLSVLGLQNFTIVSALDEGIGGLSGNLIFFVTDHANEKIMVVKAFTVNAKDQQYDDELQANQLLKALNLKHSKPIKQLFFVKRNTFNVIGMEYAQGMSLESMYKKLDNYAVDTVERNIQLKKINVNFYMFGFALAELHTVGSKKIEQVTRKDIQEFLGVSDKIISEIAASRELIGSVDVCRLHVLKEILVNEFLKNPGYYSYLHGDAQPGNFFIDNVHENVTMIDLTTALKFVDDQGDPCGYSAYDYYQFLANIDFGGMGRYELTSQEKSIIRESFVDGYNAAIVQGGNNLLTFESSRFFQFYWNLRSIQFDLLHLKYIKKTDSYYPVLLSSMRDKFAIIDSFIPVQ